VTPPGVVANAVSEPGRALYVSPDGTREAAGTVDAPLSLEAALSGSGPVRPGDTVWLRSGRYTGVFVSEINGTSEAPIVVRSAPGERVTIDSAPSNGPLLTVLGSWTEFHDLELTNSDPQRSAAEPGPWPGDIRRGAGVFARGPHNKFINLVIHDLGGGLGIWTESEGSLVYGNVIYYNGWEGPDRAHGHGIYTQNKTGDRVIAENVIFNQYSHGIHAYGSSEAFLDNITLRGNIVFNNGLISEGGAERNILIGGGAVAKRGVVVENATYGIPENNLGYGAGCSDMIVSRNYFVAHVPLHLVRCAPRMTGNFIFGLLGDLPDAYPENLYASDTQRPTGLYTMLRPNQYDPARAHVVVYNWDKRPVVEIESRDFLKDGDAFELIDVQNYFGAPVASGVFRPGEPIRIPMIGLTPAPTVGRVSVAPTHTAPEFGVFLLRTIPSDRP
jgi:hypothetical protein